MCARARVCVRVRVSVCVCARVYAGEHLHGHDGMLDLKGQQVPRDDLLQVLHLLGPPPLAEVVDQCKAHLAEVQCAVCSVHCGDLGCGSRF